MPDKSGQSFAFAALTPIISGSTQGVVHAAELRSVLARLDALAVSPFTRVSGTHFARLVVLPGAAWVEKDAIYTNEQGMVQAA